MRAQLEGRDAGGYAPLYLTGPWPKTPLARYGAAISFGVPRWYGSRRTDGRQRRIVIVLAGGGTRGHRL